MKAKIICVFFKNYVKIKLTDTINHSFQRCKIYFCVPYCYGYRNILFPTQITIYEVKNHKASLLDLT